MVFYSFVVKMLTLLEVGLKRRDHVSSDHVTSDVIRDTDISDNG